MKFFLMTYIIFSILLMYIHRYIEDCKIRRKKNTAKKCCFQFCKKMNQFEKFLKVTFNDLNNIHVGRYNIPTRVLFKDF